MPRTARIVIPGTPHHVVQRGNRRQDVFFADDDYRMYLSLMKEKCEEAGTTILAYCLMTNHVHLIAVPQTPDGFAAFGRGAPSLHPLHQFQTRLARLPMAGPVFLLPDG